MRTPRRPDAQRFRTAFGTGAVQLAGFAAAALAGACAREEPPPGAHPDRIPPSVREFRPEPFSVVPGFGGSAEVTFDEPISGASGLERQIIASPAGRYGFEASFSTIKIRPRDGWSDGVVYVFRFPSGIADLLGNRTNSAIDLVFSTGPGISRTRVAGTVSQRVDEMPAGQGRVLFFNVAGDSVPYTAVTERDGTFELSYLPPDEYWAFAFADLNANLRLERLFEPHDSARFEMEEEGFTLLAFRIVEPDTTPPVLVRATATDSVQIRVEFDDYLDPEQEFSELTVAVRQLESGSVWAVEGVRLEEVARRGPAARQRPPPVPDREVERPPAEAEPDTARAEGMAPDTAGAEPPVGGPVARPDTAGIEALDAAEEGVQEPPLPSQALLIRLVSPLQEGSYRVTIDSIRNLRGLAGVGDTTVIYPEPAESAP